MRAAFSSWRGAASSSRRATRSRRPTSARWRARSRRGRPRARRPRAARSWLRPAADVSSSCSCSRTPRVGRRAAADGCARGRAAAADGKRAAERSQPRRRRSRCCCCRRRWSSCDCKQPEIFSQRIEELGYLANVLIAGSSGRRPRPVEALEQAIAVCNTGLERALGADRAARARRRAAGRDLGRPAISPRLSRLTASADWSWYERVARVARRR